MKGRLLLAMSHPKTVGAFAVFGTPYPRGEEGGPGGPRRVGRRDALRTPLPRSGRDDRSVRRGGASTGPRAAVAGAGLAGKDLRYHRGQGPPNGGGGRVDPRKSTFRLPSATSHPASHPGWPAVDLDRQPGRGWVPDSGGRPPVLLQRGR